jgi:hypothetical protein
MKLREKLFATIAALTVAAVILIAFDLVRTSETQYVRQIPPALEAQAYRDYLAKFEKDCQAAPSTPVDPLLLSICSRGPQEKEAWLLRERSCPFLLESSSCRPAGTRTLRDHETARLRLGIVAFTAGLLLAITAIWTRQAHTTVTSPFAVDGPDPSPSSKPAVRVPDGEDSRKEVLRSLSTLHNKGLLSDQEHERLVQQIDDSQPENN